VLPEVGESPLPRHKPSLSAIHSQHGVQVERSGSGDYRMPGNGLVQIQTN